MHSNMYSEIRAHQRSKTASKAIAASLAAIAVVGVVLMAGWMRMAHAMQSSGYSTAVHLCVSEYRAFNQTGIKPVRDVSQCLVNPYQID